MPLSPEMNPFQAEVGGNQRLVTRGYLQDGAIVSDAGSNPLSSGSPIPDVRDQSFFGVRQRAPIPRTGLLYKEGMFKKESDRTAPAEEVGNLNRLRPIEQAPLVAGHGYWSNGPAVELVLCTQPSPR